MILQSINFKQTEQLYNNKTPFFLFFFTKALKYNNLMQQLLKSLTQRTIFFV